MTTVVCVIAACAARLLWVGAVALGLAMDAHEHELRQRYGWED